LSASAASHPAHLPAPQNFTPPKLHAPQNFTPPKTEREVLDACLRVLDASGPGPSGVPVTPAIAELLAPLVALFAVSCVESDLAWFMSMEIIPPKVGW
jgi:hypothetical protein